MSTNRAADPNVDNVKSITDGNNSNQRQCFQYDDRNRPTHAYTGTGGTGGCANVDNTTGSSPPPYNQTFTYSPSGNFLTAAGRSYGYGTTKPHAPTSVGSDSFVYNENGAELGRTVGGVGAIFGYDELNHLTSVTQSSGTSTYVYGPDDQRLIRKDGTTVTLYLEGNYQAQSVNGAAATVTKYYAIGSQRVAVREGSTLSYELADHLGSASATTDSSGNGLTRQNYYPFGALRPGPGNNLPVDETFLGKTRDDATGLTQLGARYYDSSIGRFISPDPLSDPANPQSINPYAYAANAPVTLSDPTGLSAFGFDLSGLEKHFDPAGYARRTAGYRASRAHSCWRGMGAVCSYLRGGSKGGTFGKQFNRFMEKALRHDMWLQSRHADPRIVMMSILCGQLSNCARYNELDEMLERSSDWYRTVEAAMVIAGTASEMAMAANGEALVRDPVFGVRTSAPELPEMATETKARGSPRRSTTPVVRTLHRLRQTVFVPGATRRRTAN
jgi:RHS repeat-associated protein